MTKNLIAIAVAIGVAFSVPAYADVSAEIAALKQQHEAEISALKIEMQLLTNHVSRNTISPSGLEASVESAVSRRDGRIYQTVEEALKRRGASVDDGLEARIMAELSRRDGQAGAPSFDAEFGQRVNMAVRASEARQDAAMRAFVSSEIDRLRSEVGGRGADTTAASSGVNTEVIKRLEELERELRARGATRAIEGLPDAQGIVAGLSGRIDGIERSIEMLALAPSRGATVPGEIYQRLASLEAVAAAAPPPQAATVRSPVGNPGMADLLGRMERAEGDIATMLELAGQLRGELEGVVSQINAAMETMSGDVRLVATSQTDLEKRAAVGYDALALELADMIKRLDRVEGVLRID